MLLCVGPVPDAAAPGVRTFEAVPTAAFLTAPAADLARPRALSLALRAETKNSTALDSLGRSGGDSRSASGFAPKNVEPIAEIEDLAARPTLSLAFSAETKNSTIFDS